MIHIKSQDARHQYDKDGNAITTWCDKRANWMVNKEYENSEINWWGKDNDFPGGCTEEDYEELYPNWNKLPNIIVEWTWTKEGYFKAFREYLKIPDPKYAHIRHMLTPGEINKHTYMNAPDSYYPKTETRSWGYLDYTKEKAIESLGSYCKFNEYAFTKVYYNGELISDKPPVNE